ncbi:MAG TPA: tetratricopeptide repeat protein [Candidatus Krumholzibacteria bacterium]|nr:tetratricopeptide repeat protein [Candidatus Krumholzibacteria bacterium]
MSKAANIRKKALDLVRQQDWANAIKEYRRLVEIDQNNPNVHNELADLYLRTNQKNEAFDSFIRAIDEYTRVGLYNNAVAVCKKVLRVLPNRSEVLSKLGLIRMKQGLSKEAESYYVSFLERAAGGGFDAEAFQKLAVAIASEMAVSTLVLQRLAQCLLGYRLNDDAADVLIKLYLLQEKNGDTSGCEDTRALVTKLGVVAKLDALAGKSRTDHTVVTEDNLWTNTHSEGERIGIESTPRFTPPSQAQPASSAPEPAPVSDGPSERDQWLLRLARGVGGTGRSKPAPATEAASSSAVGVAEPKPVIIAGAAPTDDAVTTEETAPAVASAPAPEPDLQIDPSPSTPARTSQPSKDGIQISALIDDGAAADEEDYRSHYDLGMAYIEMELLSEAIREYQIASKSPQFQVKCLEMIGLCFLKQNQPQLAIRQLTKGLSLIGGDGDESIGIKYNLGLAYEMTGDVENARVHFEDVYVVDVTFRDVAEKIRKLSG